MIKVFNLLADRLTMSATLDMSNISVVYLINIMYGKYEKINC